MAEPSFTFSWEIRDFSLCAFNESTPLKSDIFVAPILNDTRWDLKLLHGSQFVSIFLERQPDDDGPETIKLSVTFRLVAANGTTGYNKSNTTSFESGDTLGCNEFALASDIRKFYLLDDTLRLECVLLRVERPPTTRNVIARTDVEAVKTSKKWEVKGFGSLRRGDVVSVGLPVSEGRVSAHFNVKHVIEEKFGRETVSIRFVRQSVDPRIKTLSVIARIAVLDVDGLETEVWKKDRFVFRNPMEDETWEFPTFIWKTAIMDQRKKYLLKDVLTLKCDMSISTGKAGSGVLQNRVSPLELESPIHRWTEDMEGLRTSELYADVTLRASDGDTVAAHRVVLAARSEIFAKMLDDRKKPDDDTSVLPSEKLRSPKIPNDNVLDSIKTSDTQKQPIDDDVSLSSKESFEIFDSSKSLDDENISDVLGDTTSSWPDHDDIQDLKYTRFAESTSSQKRSDCTRNSTSKKPAKTLNYQKRLGYEALDLSTKGSSKMSDSIDKSPYVEIILDKPDLGCQKKPEYNDRHCQSKPDFSGMDCQRRPDHDNLQDSRKMSIVETPFLGTLASQKRPDYTLNSTFTRFSQTCNDQESLDSHAQDLTREQSSGPKDDGVLDVHDVDMGTLKRMLNFMYTEETEDLELDDVVRLYLAAHRYQIAPLKCHCSFVLQSSLTTGNVCRVLTLADDCDDDDLESHAVDFIRRFWDRVSLSHDWVTLCRERRTLAQKAKETLSRTFGSRKCWKLI